MMARRIVNSAIRLISAVTFVIVVVVVGVIASGLASRLSAPGETVVDAGRLPVAGVANTGSADTGNEPQAGRATAIEVISDPLSAASGRISEASGRTCLAYANALQYVDVDVLDDRIAAAGGNNRWLDEGIAWVGSDADAVVRAFDASWAARASEADGPIWVQVSRESKPVALQLRSTVTPKGYTVWRVGDSIAPSPHTCEDGG